MKPLKIIVFLLLAYVGVIVLFESLLGYFQPASQNTLFITTTDDDGEQSRRVLARLETDGQIYIAANHWPRSWYRAHDPTLPPACSAQTHARSPRPPLVTNRRKRAVPSCRPIARHRKTKSR